MREQKVYQLKIVYWFKFIWHYFHSHFFWLTSSIGPRWCIQTWWSRRRPCWKAWARPPLAACPCSLPWGFQLPLNPCSPREAPGPSARLRWLPNCGLEGQFDWTDGCIHLYSKWGHSSAKFSYFMTYRKGSWQTLVDMFTQFRLFLMVRLPASEADWHPVLVPLFQILLQQPSHKLDSFIYWESCETTNWAVLYLESYSIRICVFQADHKLDSLIFRKFGGLTWKRWFYQADHTLT